MANKLIRLGHSGIEYLDKVWNFYSGCRHQQTGVCPPIPCWAETMAGRFHDHYPNGFEPTFYPEAFLSPLHLKKPSRIGVAFMGDLFGEWNNPIDARSYDDHLKNYKRYISPLCNWLQVWETIKQCPQHTFVFLTKNPAGMIPWSPFPDNCEAGFSATNPEEFWHRFWETEKIDAKVKWCSFEPLLYWGDEYRNHFHSDVWEELDWVAIGALTGTERHLRDLAPKYPQLTPFQLSGNQWGLMPPIAWLKSIVEQLDAAGTKVFIKNNLHKWMYENKCYEPIFIQRQEYGAREKK